MNNPLTLATDLARAGKVDMALEVLAQAINDSPDGVRLTHHYVKILVAIGRLDLAEDACRLALDNSGGADAQINADYGVILYHQARYAEAVVYLRKAIEADPKDATSLSNLGAALQSLRKLAEAEQAYRECLSIDPDNAEAIANLGVLNFDMGMPRKAIEYYRRALKSAPDLIAVHSNLIQAMHYLPEITQQAIHDELSNWNARHAAPLWPKEPVQPRDPTPGRKLRVGFLSGGFRRHPVGFLAIAAIEALPKDLFEIVIYSNNALSDDLTERFKKSADLWRDISGMDDSSGIDLIREDSIDILIDLSGHGAGGRLLIVARSAAPVQVKWIGGQFNSTGMNAFDAFITDSTETPEGDERWYAERKIVRLPGDYVCYAPPSYVPGVSPLPAREKGFINFACFNNPAKINEDVADVWGKILTAVPGSRLALRGRAYEERPVREYFTKMFKDAGIDPDRVSFLGQAPHRELLESYGDIDISLDPFPYSGGLTTIESLWMGIPVVTLFGATFAGRHAATHLVNTGMAEWVAPDRDTYVSTAIEWARDIDRLAGLRGALREKVRTSPLCDSALFADNLGKALRNLWLDRCATSSR
ncbi:MAG: tetratricopeptide repeat protein [Rhodospirillales bacterium]|nr:tetratricopeptide repeat protein [Rhodospirillales bacterium]MCW9002631.1 tetratricopeptide repeat protein [Rhodospirillales bacterium]